MLESLDVIGTQSSFCTSFESECSILATPANSRSSQAPVRIFWLFLAVYDTTTMEMVNPSKIGPPRTQAEREAIIDGNILKFRVCPLRNLNDNLSWVDRERDDLTFG